MDSGSALDCLDKDTYYSLLNAPKLKQSAHSTVYGIDEAPTTCYSMFYTNISITHNGVTSDLGIDLYVINCWLQEGIFGRPFLVNHRAVLDAGSRDLSLVSKDVLSRQRTNYERPLKWRYHLYQGYPNKKRKESMEKVLKSIPNTNWL